MCGIAGYSRNVQTSIPHGGKFAVTLAHSIEDRGRDSTGFGWGQKDDEDHVYYAKLPGKATKVADTLPLPGRGIHTLMAHTRHGTKGRASDNDNNHPIVAEHIVCVHNGRVDNDDDLIDMAGMKESRLGIVDSWAIPAVLARQEQLGASTTDLLELIEGCAAIAWMSSHEPGVLHLARLSTRPLTLGWTKRGDLVFASTTANLRKASDLGNIGIEDVTSLKEGTHLTIVNGGIEAWEEFKPRHPKIQYAVDMPGQSSPRPTNAYQPGKAKGKGKRKGKGKGGNKPTSVMSHAEYLDYREQERLYREMQSLQTASDTTFLDSLPDNAWEREVDWDSIVPRRGHSGT